MNRESEDTKRLTRQQDRCSVSLVIRDLAGYAIEEQRIVQVAHIDDALWLVGALSNHVDDELTSLEKSRDDS